MLDLHFIGAVCNHFFLLISNPIKLPRLRIAYEFIRKSKRSIHEQVEVEVIFSCQTLLLKLINRSSRPANAVFLRHSILFRNLNRGEKTADFLPGHLIRDLSDHDHSEKTGARSRNTDLFLSKEPVEFWVKIDSVR
ncbi:hypothetical protein ACN38_g13090 [Penicillium nordicum]|uniref:Uncharacterized protein n=1 Tax=Penicillium nordicum TaxID=229535 RepID=A0A0M8NXA3_9EURO|nr:hypothetical protein ACN38_g13090 [Penicillium nordicum]